MELEELLELLYGPEERFRSVRATVRRWHHVDRLTLLRANEGKVRHGSTVSGALTAGSSEEAPEDVTRLERLWIVRARVRREDGDGQVVVFDGETATTYVPEWGVTKERYESSGDDLGVGELFLDPQPLLAGLDFAIGDRVTAAGRDAVVVSAVPRPGLVDWHDFGGLAPGADAYELVVDLERGVLLRATALLENEPAAITEVVEIAFDETFAPETFAVEVLPDTPVHELDDMTPPPIEHLSIEEAAVRAPFTVWIPSRVPDGLRAMEVTYLGADERWGRKELVWIDYRSDDWDARVALQLHEQLRPDEPQVVGVRLVISSGQEPVILVVERGETQITLHGEGISEEQLAEIGASLVPAPKEPPRLGKT